MKVLIISHAQYQMNAYQKHFERALSLVEKGHEVTFLITSNKEKYRTIKENISKVNVIMVPDLMWGVLRQGLGPINILRRCFIVLSLKYDVVHGIDCRPVTVIPALVGKYIKKKYMFLEWTDLFGRGGTMLERSSKMYINTFGRIESFFEEKFRKYADGNIAISHKLKNVLLSLGYPENKILVLPLASNLNNIVRKSKSDLRKELKLDETNIFLLYVGSIFKSDSELLIGAFKEIRNIRPDTRLILVGKHKWLNDDIKKELDIMVTGFVSDEDLFKYIGAADIHLLPLKTTMANLARFPCKVNDYFLGCRPLVTTPISDLPILYSKYNFGIVSKSDSKEDFTNSILEAINHKDNWNNWGHSAVTCARKEFALEEISNKLEKFYNQIINERKYAN